MMKRATTGQGNAATKLPRRAVLRPVIKAIAAPEAPSTRQSVNRPLKVRVSGEFQVPPIRCQQRICLDHQRRRAPL
jgi:hypothetical protein